MHTMASDEHLPLNTDASGASCTDPDDPTCCENPLKSLPSDAGADGSPPARRGLEPSYMAPVAIMMMGTMATFLFADDPSLGHRLEILIWGLGPAVANHLSRMWVGRFTLLLGWLAMAAHASVAVILERPDMLFGVAPENVVEAGTRYAAIQDTFAVARRASQGVVLVWSLLYIVSKRRPI